MTPSSIENDLITVTTHLWNTLAQELNAPPLPEKSDNANHGSNDLIDDELDAYGDDGNDDDASGFDGNVQ